MARKKRTHIDLPYTILFDSNEQLPYRFTDIQADAKQGYLPIRVQTRKANLMTGDYTLEGWQDIVTVERKSHSDFVKTILQGRDRFVAELERMAQLHCAFVVVEAEWRDILEANSAKTKTIIRSVMAWNVRYPIRWWFVNGRRMGEVVTFRLLNFVYEQFKKDTAAILAQHAKRLAHYGDPEPPKYPFPRDDEQDDIPF